jgi:peptidoglycan/LPS O-acetylase OafA/YrhL
MPRDLIATTLYAGNWALALQPHYETRLLSHTWSLGVEEQFYIVWPVALGALLGVAGLRRRRHGGPDRRFLVPAAVVAALAAASCLERWLLWRAGTPGPRISWGTDTRASALLAGAALALCCYGGALPRGRTGRTLTQLAGWVALGWLVFAFVGRRFAIPAISADPARNFVEGMTAVAAASALLVAGVVAAPSGALARLLALRPLVWVGRVSYGLYLFHFPIFLAVGTESTGWPAPAVLAARLGLTLAVTVASWRWIEQPFLRAKRAFEVTR